MGSCQGQPVSGRGNYQKNGTCVSYQVQLRSSGIWTLGEQVRHCMKLTRIYHKQIGLQNCQK